MSWPRIHQRAPSLALLLASLATLVACGTQPLSMSVSTPALLSIGSVDSAYVYVGRENSPTETRFRVVSAMCRSDACDTTIGERGEVLVLAKAPGKTDLTIAVETDDGESLEKTVPITFWQPDAIEVVNRTNNLLKPGIGLLVGSRATWELVATHSALLDPLSVSQNAVTVDLRGDAVQIGVESTTIGVVAKEAGDAIATFGTAGVTTSLPLRIVSERDVVGVELWMDYQFEDVSPVTPMPTFVPSLHYAQFVPVLRLRDGSIAVGGAKNVSFEPADLVRLSALSDQIVKIESERAGRGFLRCTIGDASVSLAIDLDDPPWK